MEAFAKYRGSMRNGLRRKGRHGGRNRRGLGRRQGDGGDEACRRQCGGRSLFTASYTGTNGALVVITADDPSLHSSQNEQDNRHYARFAKIPMLEPADSEEAKAFIKRAFELSEKLTPRSFSVRPRGFRIPSPS